jgi:hypothetical protein
MKRVALLVWKKQKVYVIDHGIPSTKALFKIIPQKILGKNN